MTGFENMKSFPCVLGAIDGTHIQIKTRPSDCHPSAYLNRKRDYSVK